MEASIWYHSFVLLIHYAQYASGHNILMNAIFGEGSHFLCAASVGERLVGQGHNVTFLISNAYAHRASDPKYSNLFEFEIFRHAFPVEAVHERYNAIADHVFKSHNMRSTGIMNDGPVADCDALLADVEIMSRLRSSNFSVVYYDITWLCPLLIAKHLQIPYIAQSALSSPCTITGSSSSSYSLAFVPVMRTGLSNKMNFRNRVVNLFAHIRMQYFFGYSHSQYDKLKHKYNIAPYTSIPQLISQGELFLVNTDFSVEFPCAIPPNVIPVGGLTTGPSLPLPGDLEDFMQSSGQDGVIVCTMGTYLTTIPIQILETFLNAFGRLPQKVIFQLSTTPPGISLPPNVHTSPWLPQNDLLGHAKTRAFLFHGGNNGFYEALYHAVPMAVVPLYSDQYDTGAKVDAHKIGIVIDKLSLTEDSIYSALRDITTKVSYKRNIQRMSAMFRDRPMSPAEKAAFWIDHVIKHGGDQYRMPSFDLSFIERNLIDVLFFAIICLVSGLFVLLMMGTFLLKVIANVISASVKVKKE